MSTWYPGALSRVGAAVIIALVSVGCGQAISPPAATRSPTAPPSQLEQADGLRLTLNDEFDGPPGSPPDPSIWQPDVGGTGWGNEELQYYTANDNTYLDGQGHLVIEARAGSEGHSCWYGPCRYTSGKLTTWERFAQQYGRFEARIKVPSDAGMWSAFWLLGASIDAVGHPAAGEIDVFEALGGRADEVEQHAHGPGLNFGDGFTLPAGQSVTDWHTYAVQWSADRIAWQVDGQTTRVLTRAGADSGWVFDRSFFLLLNLAVGGEWPGPPNAATQFPARMHVDYVRVYGGVDS